jgi:hypothetical protein
MKKYRVIAERVEYYQAEVMADSEEEANILANQLNCWEEIDGSSFRIDKESTEEV